MNILDSRILLKRSTTAGATPTVPASSSHTDGTWVNTDIYEGELFLNTADARLFTRQGSNIKEIGLQNSLIGTPQYATYTLTSAQILALYTTPVTIIPAQGVGKYIVTTKIYGRINYNTTTYNGGLQGLKFKIVGANGDSALLGFLVTSTVTRVIPAYIYADNVGTTSDTQLLPNAGLQVSLSTATPTTGDSTIDLLVEYMVLDFDTIF